MQKELDVFDFERFDAQKTTALVDQLDARIAELNQIRYTLKHSIAELERGLAADRITFDPEKAKVLFEEAGVNFPDQVKIDFEQLIAFNRAITEERNVYLKEELKSFKLELAIVSSELDILNEQRSQSLSYLRSEDVFKKYRALSAEIAKAATEVELLKHQQNKLSDIQDRRRKLRQTTATYAEPQSEAEKVLSQASQERSSLLSKVREYFSALLKDVLGRDAILSVSLNGEGNLEFDTDFVGGNETTTSEADGTSYKKLLCVAFDLAVIRAHLDSRFRRFVFHDGVFELLDPRPRKNLLESIRMSADAGVQSIVTVMDFDLPIKDDGSGVDIADEEIILRLHDNGPKGRLFHFEKW